MKILSIDWDYFFPDASGYDWGANEEQAVFYEAIWSLRISAVNLLTKEKAFDVFRPSIPEGFWKIVTNEPTIYVTDSHSDIYQLLQLEKHNEIYNIDAHHDCGYDWYSLYVEGNLNCGNWGFIGHQEKLIKKFHQYYPLWRINNPEGPSAFELTTINYGLPAPQEYDQVFICRSSCWTPPWSDTQFSSFVDKPNTHTSVKPRFSMEALL